MKRYKFEEIFKVENDTITPIKPIKVNGMTYGSDVSLKLGGLIGGISFSLFNNLDMAVEESDTLIIKGFYK